MEVNNAATARKVLKADREKLRRDKLNEQFLELGNTLGKRMLISFLGKIKKHSNLCGPTLLETML